MKKTFEFLNMAALLVVGAIMTGCSSDDNFDRPLQPANNDNVVTLTATVSLDGAAGTRAINGTTGVKTFESTNKIAVIYKNGDGTQKAESGALTLSADGTKATFTVSLTSPTSNSAIRYIYPATMAKDVATDATITDDAATIDYSGLFSSQDGTLETLGTNYDLAVFDGSLSGTDLPASATLANPLAICKFTFKDTGSSDISGITRLTISDRTNTYGISTSGLSEIYVAMKPVASGNIAFTAATASKTYFRTVTRKSLVASKLYTNITVGSMVELAVGNVISYDGMIFANKAGAEAVETDAAAVIVYLGSDTKDATFKNGLAIALADEGSMNWSTAMSTCGAKTAITGAKWCLPSQEQWKQMFKANGGNDAKYTDLNTTITTAGGTTLKKFEKYWSSSEDDPGVSAYFVLLVDDGNANWASQREENEYTEVRACLAF